MHRAHIYLNGQHDVSNFVAELNKIDGEFYLENFDGTYRVNAKSLLGVLYIATEYNNETFVGSLAHELPTCIDKYRV